MERLTERNENNLAMAACCGKACEYNYVCEVGGFGECRGMDDIIDRLADIEDILGDDYDLDRLKVIVNQCVTMREEVSQRFSLTANIPIDRLKELVEADRDGRSFILPPDDFPWTIRGDVMRDLVRCNCRAYKKVHEIIQETQVKGEPDG